MADRLSEVLERLGAAISLVTARPASLWAAVTLRPFSLTSFRMVDDLRRQGIVPRTVIDVGANIGQFARAAAHHWPSVALHSFEPQPDCFRALQRALARVPGARCYQLGVGSERGVLEMHVNAHDHSSSLLPLGESHREAFPSAAESGTVQVRVTTLDAELDGQPLQHPVLLKIDVQGYERWVLDGAPRTLASVDFLVLELSFRELYEGEPLFFEMVEYCRSLGFAFARPIGWLVHPRTGEYLQCDALFVRAGHAPRSPSRPDPMT